MLSTNVQGERQDGTSGHRHAGRFHHSERNRRARHHRRGQQAEHSCARGRKLITRWIDKHKGRQQVLQVDRPAAQRACARRS
eukprot:6210704-Pleurochrysis_carterae.AAC.3